MDFKYDTNRIVNEMSSCMVKIDNYVEKNKSLLPYEIVEILEQTSKELLRAIGSLYLHTSELASVIEGIHALNLKLDKTTYSRFLFHLKAYAIKFDLTLDKDVYFETVNKYFEDENMRTLLKQLLRR